ncbi:family 5 carbohydrate esterase [Cryphonectria parasitica EP155]|uniref:cutinase n=1 Tax=Cryphonectria parasitica (strain ATCC 38755 / EP155) TaxID=660469 RepID=A0A9P5CL11_CRYP1|nr:family 5 carbohydrate esterase [Cryphonectria parasitica EP155]KAF3762844.1 family 5 carbohydrate esterase [Cryphonectria parasitica EP155]
MKTSNAFCVISFAALSAGSPLPQATSASSCTTYTLLFARGTTETGTLGTIVGPGLEKSVESTLGATEVTVQGVAYAADVAGIAEEVTGSGPGSVAMAQEAATALSSCPDTKLILTGYSQGAMVVHNAATKLKSSSQISSVVAAVTFGDPYKTELPAGIATADFHTFCATGDEVCAYGVGTCAGSGGCTSSSTLGHLGYGADVDAAASFIQSAVNGSSTSSTASAALAATTTAVALSSDAGAVSGLDLDSALGSLPTDLSDLGFSIPTAIPTLGSGVGSSFSIPAFSIPAALPTSLSGLGIGGL